MDSFIKTLKNSHISSIIRRKGLFDEYLNREVYLSSESFSGRDFLIDYDKEYIFLENVGKIPIKSIKLLIKVTR